MKSMQRFILSASLASLLGGGPGLFNGFAAAARTISVNIAANGSEVSTGPYAGYDIGYDDYAVPGSNWVDCMSYGNVGNVPNTLVELPLKDDTGDAAHYAGVKLYLCSRGEPWGHNTPSDGNTQMLHSYLDDKNDATIKSGFKLTGLPFTNYTVLVYFNTDTDNGVVPAYSFNGAFYKGSPNRTVPAEDTETWGSPKYATTLDLNKNTLLVTGLTNRTLIVASSTNSAATGGNSRGTIAGFQVSGILASPSYSADVVSNATWSSKEGLENESAVWANGPEKTILLTNNLEAGASVTFDDNVQAALLTLVGTGDTTFKKSGDASLNIAAYDLTGAAGRTFFEYGTEAASVWAGADTAFTAPGRGRLGVGAGMQATWENMGWNGPVEQTGDGLIVVRGGTEAEPLAAAASPGKDTQTGPYQIDTNSCLRITTDDNRKYLVDGAGAGNGSVFIIDSGADRCFGLSEGTSLHNVKVKTTKQFWLERSAAVDGSVALEIADKLTLGNPDRNFTLGSLSGTGEIIRNGNDNNTLNVEMAYGPSVWSGKLNQGNILSVGGTNAFTLTGDGSMGELQIREGASAGYVVAEGGAIATGGKIGGAGTFFKRGPGKLTLTGNLSGCTGAFVLDEGELVLPGPAGNNTLAGAAATLAATGASITLGGLSADTPKLKVAVVSGGGTEEGKFPITVAVTDAELHSGKRLKIMQMENGITTNAFDLSIVDAVENGATHPPSQYQMTVSQDNILTINGFPKVWSGTNADTGDGEWSADTSVLAWDGMTAAFTNGEAAVFPDMSGKSPAVSVAGEVRASGVTMMHTSGLYTFNKKDDDALIELSELVPGSGETVFNVPLKTPAGVQAILPGDGARLTLAAPFGKNVSATGTNGVYDADLPVPNNGLLAIAPGAGKKQTVKQFTTGTPPGTLAITNGILTTTEKDKANGIFGNAKIRIDDGGVLLVETWDITGYNKTDAIAVNKGGELRVEVRDTLRRNLTLNGGTVTVAGEDSGRALDLFNGPVITVTADSRILGAAGGKSGKNKDGNPVDDPKIYLRKSTVVFDVAENVTLSNAVTYGDSSSSGEQQGSLTKRGAGTMVQNGMTNAAGGRFPLTYKTETKIEAGTYELNCEHQNGNGVYTVAGWTRLTGTGSITGPGTVTLAGKNAKICGGLTVNSLAFKDQTWIGDPWSVVSATVTGRLAAVGDAPSVTFYEGTFTIGKGCDTTNFRTARITFASTNGALVLKAGAALALDTAPAIGENAAAGLRIGADFSDARNPVYGAFSVNGAVDVSGWNFGVDVEAGTLRECRVPLLTAQSIAGWEGLSKAGLPEGRNWRFELVSNGDGTQTLYAEMKFGTVFILR